MSRRRGNKIGGQFDARLVEMLESPAFRVLSVSAHRVLNRIAIEHMHHGAKENGKLPVTYADFVTYGVDRHAIAPAIRELEVLGFVQVTERGRASAGEFRSPNLFRLTYAYAKKSDPPTHEWRLIATIEQAEQLARAARAASDKNKKPVGEKTNPSGGNPHRKPKSPVGETHTTAQVGKPTLLSISRVGDEYTTHQPDSQQSSEPDPAAFDRHATLVNGHAGAPPITKFPTGR